jgi:Tol biopolymer transport system component
MPRLLLFLTFGLVTLAAITAQAQTGNLCVTVRNVNGSTVSGARVIRYPGNVSVYTPSCFNSIPTGSYTCEAYYTGTFLGEEYWGDGGPITVNSSQTATLTIDRIYPYVQSITIRNHATGAIINPTDQIAPGITIRAEVTVRNKVSQALNARVRMILDRSQSLPYDFDTTSAQQSIPSNSTRTFTLTYTPTQIGTWYRAFAVITTLLNGNTPITDAWPWAQVFVVQSPTGNLCVTVRNAGGTTVAGARVVRYNPGGGTTQGTTGSDGTICWNNISTGSYSVEAYYTGTFFGEEYWGDATGTVNSGQTTNLTVNRIYPYAESITIRNHSTGTIINSSDQIDPGTTIRAEIIVRNKVSVSLNTKVRLLLDRDQSSPFDSDSTSALLSIGSNTTRTYTFTYTPTQVATWYRAFEVTTRLANGNDRRTDSWPWTQAFLINPSTLNLNGRISYHTYSSYLATPSPGDTIDGNVFLYNLDSQTLANITRSLSIKNAMNPHFSPDGSKLVFMAIAQGNPSARQNLDIYTYDLAEAELTNLTPNVGIIDEDPKFSPDGSQILWKRQGQIWRMNSDGSSQTQLTTTPDEKSGPNYSPDGTRIVYWSGASSSADIWWMNANGTSPSSLIATSGIQEYYPIYRDANNILDSRWESASDQHDKIYNYSISSSTSTRLSINMSGVEDADAYPVNTDFLVFSSTRTGGNYNVFVGRYGNGVAYTLSGANSALQDLGPIYSRYSYARKLKVLSPLSNDTLNTGQSYTLRLRAYSDGSGWTSANPSVTFSGPNTQTYTSFQHEGSGVFSKTVSLPGAIGTYTVTANAQSNEPGGTRTVSSLPVTVVLRNPSYTITASAGSNGTISPSGNVSVNYGSNQSFTITPNTGYHVANVSVDGSSVGAVTSYNFNNVTANHSISASFAINTYTITASPGSNGSISPSGNVTANHGSNQSFRMTPNTGYHVSNVIVDGSSVGAVTSYTFNNVTSNHSISASFAINTFTITASVGANGSISPSGNVTVDYGANQTFTITANANYRIANVLVDGSSVGTPSSYTFNNVTASHTISGTFTPTTSVSELDGAIPTTYSLFQNYPNPFNPITTIEFSLPKETFVELVVYNTLGVQVCNLVKERLPAGNYRTQWLPSENSSGVYFYQLRSHDFTDTKKFLLLR